MEGTSLENMLRGLVFFFTTWAGWRRHQLRLLIHVIILTVATRAQPHRRGQLAALCARRPAYVFLGGGFGPATLADPERHLFLDSCRFIKC